MLRTDLIQLINRGDVWAFVGSGISADAGAPTWAELVESVVRELQSELGERIREDVRFRKAYDQRDYSHCMSRIAAVAGREVLDAQVRMVIRRHQAPGHLAKLIADFPFAGYVTTNYDNILENALVQAGQLGWAVVGNTVEDVRKIAGAPDSLVWHVHGAADLDDDRSHLVLTTEDYEQLYLEDSDVSQQLRGLLTHKRVVFLGFGFRDPEVMRILRRVGRLSNPVRPVYAFLREDDSGPSDIDRKELFERYNVDVVSYQSVDYSHRPLLTVLGLYGALVVRRSVQFSQDHAPTPSYDPETTGLLVYNELCLRAGAVLAPDILRLLSRALALALLRVHGAMTPDDIVDQMEARARVITKISALNLTAEMADVLDSLQAEGLAELRIDREDETVVHLTPQGEEFVGQQAAASDRLREQFQNSLHARAYGLLNGDSAKADRVANAADGFFKDCVDRRAVGVASTLYPIAKQYQSYHMVALLQELPNFMEWLTSHEEALALSEVVQQVFRGPNAAERSYLGLALQARFGVHLLGADPDAVRVRAEDFANTLFLMDSSTLIPFLARSSVGYPSARLLIDRLVEMGSVVATTALLAQEVAEHARWAIRSVDAESRAITVDTLRSVTGKAGERSNAFLDGLVTEVSRGEAAPDLMFYLSQVCHATPTSTSCSDANVRSALAAANVPSLTFDEWEGFSEELWSERDTLAGAIADRRKARETYRHERQVQAEAEALIIVRGIRDASIRFPGRRLTTSYFISHTRAIDEVAATALPVTMRPEAALQWAATLRPVPVESLGVLVNGLLWELSERGLAIVDQTRIRLTFHPLMAASKEQLATEVDRHKSLIADRYGEHGSRAFAEVGEFEAPFILESFNAQRAEELERQLGLQKRRAETAETRKALVDRERAELDRLRRKRDEKQAKESKRRRASKSRPKKPKRGR